MDIRLRPTKKADLDFVLAAEQDKDNLPFIIQWQRKQHEAALKDSDTSHLIVERIAEPISVGYVILGELENPNQSILLKRIVVTEKGKGYGKEALRLVKQLAFEELQAHRLWLDVKEHNYRAQHIYKAAGFVVEGRLRECLKTGDRFESLVLMSILLSEYHIDQ